jgi:hypothetical protein
MTTTDPLIRPGNVDWLADAYRHKGTPLADAVLAGRHVDFTREECAAALARVLAEVHADLAILEERRRFDPDPVTARLQSLLDLSDDELEELHRAGLLDDLEAT